MKKVIVLLMAICLCLAGCGSSAPETTTAAGATTAAPETFDQFVDKYKRASWDDMVVSPMAFFRDLHGLTLAPIDQAFPDLASLESTEESYGTVYTTDVVLFNRPIGVTITDYGKFHGCSLSYKGDAAECYADFQKMFESLIASEGDPWSLSVNSDDVDEVTFRKALVSGDLDQSLSAHWTEKKETGEYTTALISYWNFTGGTLSFY